MAITAKQVKELRELTGAGMMDCKKALVETSGDMEKAIIYLREKGIASAAKKVSRVAREGLANVVFSDNMAILYEVNSETDFVAKNEKFLTLVDYIGKVLLEAKPENTEEALAYVHEGKALEETLKEATSTIGENIQLRRVTKIVKNDEEVFGSYKHMGGSIVSIAAVVGSEEVAKNIAMHVAALNPKYLSKLDVEQEFIDSEKQILLNQALEENKTEAKPKPENIIERIVEGRLNKQLEEVCLLEQTYVKDGDLKIKQYIKNENATIVSYNRLEVGEGIEKREEDFAAEVSGQIKA